MGVDRLRDDRLRMNRWAAGVSILAAGLMLGMANEASAQRVQIECRGFGTNDDGSTFEAGSEYEHRPGDRTRFDLLLCGVTPGADYVICFSADSCDFVISAQGSSNGQIFVRYRTDDGNFPPDFPFLASGDVLYVNDQAVAVYTNGENNFNCNSNGNGNGNENENGNGNGNGNDNGGGGQGCQGAIKAKYAQRGDPDKVKGKLKGYDAGATYVVSLINSGGTVVGTQSITTSSDGRAKFTFSGVTCSGAPHTVSNDTCGQVSAVTRVCGG
ncbi:MAG: hypothetical protein AMXMBFR22_23530 [Phycisphaerae bacterium]